MVGHYTSGNMADPEEQGIDGATIQQVIDNVRSALQLRPNVVLLHAGTNDMYVKHHQERHGLRSQYDTGMVTSIQLVHLAAFRA